MSAKWRLDWQGPRIKAKTRQAVLDGLNETAFAAELRAKELAPVDTGFLRSTIAVTRQAAFQGSRASVEFGNEVADYALWNEIGTARMPARPYLRPAADSEFPKLAARIAARGGK